METIEYRVGPEDAGERLDRWLSGQNSDMSRSMLQGLMEAGQVLLCGGPAVKNARLKAGDTVQLTVPDAAPSETIAQDIPLDIVYEDDHLLVVNKPKGMVVHPAPGNPDGTLVNALLYHCGSSLSGIGGVQRPGIVHRIDKDTSGLLVVAKDDVTHNGLSAQMSVHSIERVYHAVVYGRMKETEGFVEAPLGRDTRDRKKMAIVTGGRYAYTGWKMLEEYSRFSYIACQLKTGRTHQIRVHMASIGHPLAGDAVYGPKACITALHGQCLHAKTLGFIHPVTGEHLRFDAPLPAYFEEYLEKLRKGERA